MMWALKVTRSTMAATRAGVGNDLALAERRLEATAIEA